MCGRFLFSEDDDRDDIRRLAALTETRYPGEAWARGEVTPASRFPVLTPGGAKADVRLMTWGYPKPEGGLVINARAETAGERPLFRDSLNTGRCAILTCGYFEWSAGPEKTKYLFCPEGGVAYLAGLFRLREGQEQYVILTTAAVGPALEVHGRMPVLLRRGEVLRWLREPDWAREVLRRPGPPLRGRAVPAREAAG